MLISVLVAAVAIIGFWLGGTFWILLIGMRRLDEGAMKAGSAALVLAGLTFFSPYLAWSGFSAYASSGAHLREYVPGSLHIESKEFGQEDWSGIGLPGDNESGFAAFRLTSDSAVWARAQGSALRDRLDERTWLPTPVTITAMLGRAEKAVVSRSPTADYLSRYGVFIQVPFEHLRHADTALGDSGGFWTAGRGGSITLVSPKQGRVFVFYAG